MAQPGPVEDLAAARCGAGSPGDEGAEVDRAVRLVGEVGAEAARQQDGREEAGVEHVEEFAGAAQPDAHLVGGLVVDEFQVGFAEGGPAAVGADLVGDEEGVEVGVEPADGADLGGACAGAQGAPDLPGHLGGGVRGEGVEEAAGEAAPAAVHLVDAEPARSGVALEEVRVAERACEGPVGQPVAEALEQVGGQDDLVGSVGVAVDGVPDGCHGLGAQVRQCGGPGGEGVGGVEGGEPAGGLPGVGDLAAELPGVRAGVRAAAAGAVAGDEPVADDPAQEVSEVEEFRQCGDLAERLVVAGVEEAFEVDGARGDDVLGDRAERGGHGRDGAPGGGQRLGPSPGQAGQQGGAVRSGGVGERRGHPVELV
ncbi:hypothetical protein VR44_27300, partial [Streptomyces katrae]